MSRVFKRGKYWYIDYVANGKRRRERASRHKKFATLRLNEIELQKERGELKIPDDCAIDEFFENFLTYAKAHTCETTLESYERVVIVFKRFLSSNWPVKKLSRVTGQTLEEFKLKRLKSVSKVTVNYDLKVLTTAFNWAKKQNYLTQNPVSAVERFKVVKKQKRFFSKAEIQMILSQCPENMYPVYMILLHTGMRKGELLNLEWKDIDFERRVVKIQPKESWLPKGKRGREIPISDELLEVLAEHRTQSEGQYVVLRTSRNRYHKSLLEKFKRFAQKLGIEDATIHTFRHTFASHLVMANVDLVTVKELLGHSDVQTTMIYAHLAEGHKHGAVNRLAPWIEVGTNLAPTKKPVNVSYLN